MKESNSNLSIQLLKNSNGYSNEQVKVMKELAIKHGLNFGQVEDLLAAVGEFVLLEARKKNIIHIQRFGKFIPVDERKRGKNNIQDPEQESPDTV